MRFLIATFFALSLIIDAHAVGISEQIQRQQVQPLQRTSMRVVPPSNLPRPSPLVPPPTGRHETAVQPEITASAPVASDALGASFTYDAVGNRESAIYPNGMVTLYQHDRRNRLVEVHTSRNGALIHRYNYTLDPSGLRTRVEAVEADGTTRITQYTYDFVKRLTGEVQTRNGVEELRATYEYDQVGNRTKVVANGVSTTYIYDANDWLTSETASGGAAAGTTTYSYDQNGNRTAKDGPMGHVEYIYDDADRMVEARSAGDVVTYKYAHDGLAIEKTWTPSSGPAITWRYLWDMSRIHPETIEEWSDEGTGTFHVSATYLFGDDLIAQTRSGITRYAVLDGFGDTRALADSGGQLSDTFTYDAWGNLLGRTGTTTTDHLYRGERFDPNTGYYNLRARWMDPAVGRFTQMDSFDGFSADPASLHKYVYANADPVNRVDPSGHNSNLLGSAVTVGIVAVLATGAMMAMNHTTGDSGATNRRFSAWDAVAVTRYRTAAANHSQSQTSVVTGAVAAATINRDGHHTIPKYLCGGRVQPLADVTVPRHRMIHAGIAGIRLALAGAEEYATKTVGIGRRRNGDINRLAQTREGRQAIAAGLQEFYYYGGFWNDGQARTIGSAFTEERPRYESGANTTLPWCSESGEP